MQNGWLKGKYMKPIKTARKLTLNRESLRQMTPRALPPAALARAIGGVSGPPADEPADQGERWPILGSICCCYMTSE